MTGRRKTLLFRQVNERIGELLGRAGLTAEADFVCECGRGKCTRRVTLRLHEYEALRRSGVVVVAPECRAATAGRPAQGEPARALPA